MATINISDICPAGYDLFLDNEGYMTDLNENGVDYVVGGTGTLLSLAAAAAGYAAGEALS
jgi:hypothetical protein